MWLHLNDDDSTPLYRQIAAAVRRALIADELHAGDALPPARMLAQTLGVNMHTVLRGYAELEHEGLVRMRRGRGATISGASPTQARLQELVLELVDEGRRLGITREKLITMMEEIQ